MSTRKLFRVRPQNELWTGLSVPQIRTGIGSASDFSLLVAEITKPIQYMLEVMAYSGQGPLLDETAHLILREY